MVVHSWPLSVGLEISSAGVETAIAPIMRALDEVLRSLMSTGGMPVMNLSATSTISRWSRTSLRSSLSLLVERSLTLRA